MDPAAAEKLTNSVWAWAIGQGVLGVVLLLFIFVALMLMRRALSQADEDRKALRELLPQHYANKRADRQVIRKLTKQVGANRAHCKFVPANGSGGFSLPAQGGVK